MSEKHSSVSNATIAANPLLFQVHTPINIPNFEKLLHTHPNRPFVDSVVNGLRCGMWPWADTTEEFPITRDFPNRPLKSDHEKDFVRKQFDIEISAGHFSPSFGSSLLPGMYSVPIHTVPKPHSDKLCLIVDHSAGSFSLNSMIDRDLISGVKLDGIRSLG
ncbi:hypothetical protein BJ138DRAFT_998281, partial [Hygrophoropsis aurantiaca]